MKLETRIFICFLLTLIFILCSGCHSIKHEWFPKNNTKLTKDEKETGAVKGAVIKINF